MYQAHPAHFSRVLMSSKANPAQLLQACVDEDYESYFRLLFEDKTVRYITIAPGLYTADDMCFGPAMVSLLPPLPSGNWNSGYVSHDPLTGQPHFESATRKMLKGIANAWHPTKIDHLALSMGRKIRSATYEATSPLLEGCVIAKFARFEWEIGQVDAESKAYQWLEGTNIGPKFMGHIVEEGRVIGLLIEQIENARHADVADLSACEEALKKLHRLGILHGDVNKHNFLINGDGVTLIDFDCARKTEDAKAFEIEMESLAVQLRDSSGKGGNRFSFAGKRDGE